MYERSYGARYDGSLDVAEIAKLVRKDIKAAIKAGTLPVGLKASVRISRFAGGCSLDVTVTEYPENTCTPERAAWVVENPHESFFHAPPRFTEAFTEHLEVLEGIHGAYNHNGSDSMVDYFDVKYYGHAELGYRLEAAHREEREAAYRASKEVVEAVEADGAVRVPEPTTTAEAAYAPAVVGDSKTCPKCGVTAEIDGAFGFRNLRGATVPQSWCRCCRRDAVRATRAPS